MRARWLKPEFFADKKIAQLGPIAALVYEALWCMADDGGTAPCDADTIKAQMFYRWSAVGVPDISEALRHLSDAGRIVCYQVGDDTYARIPTWAKHQQVHKPSKFRYPEMPQGDAPITPGDSSTGAAPLPASPHPRHLDSQTPRHPTTNGARAPKPRVRPSVVMTPDVEVVLAYYRELHPTRRPDEKAARAIVRALKTYGVRELCDAIRGNAHDQWCIDSGNQGLPYLLKDNATIDKYRAKAIRSDQPIVDEHGVLTEYGERITRPDKVPA